MKDQILSLINGGESFTLDTEGNKVTKGIPLQNTAFTFYNSDTTKDFVQHYLDQYNHTLQAISNIFVSVFIQKGLITIKLGLKLV